MTRKDYILIAGAMIKQIDRGFIKKKDIARAINVMSYELSIDNYRFDYGKFEDYIMKGIK